MTITVLSDIHGRIDKIDRLADQLRNSHLALLTGDITHFGKEYETKEVISKILAYQPNILAVTGNCDYPEVDYFLIKEGINLYQSSVIFEGLGFVGTGGSLPCPGKTPNEYSEDDLLSSLEIAYSSLYSSIPFVLVVHQPPYNTATDKISPESHVGSHAIRKFIETHNPIACFCGHIHESKGKDYINSTLIINPGPFKDGNFALVKITEDKQIATTFLSV